MFRRGFISIFLLILFLLTPSLSFAHSGHIEHDRVAQAVTVTTTPIDEEPATESAEPNNDTVQYELPYPGMLPDNPFYFLKTIRDAIVRFLISDPLKKAEFDILTADKRVYAAALLVEKEKYELALETLSKSNNYLHEAVFTLSEAEAEGKDIKPLTGDLNTSVKKHKEVVSQRIEPHLPENLKRSLDNENKRLETIEKSVNGLAS